MTLFPDRLEDWIGEENPVRVVDLFVNEIDLAEPGVGRMAPALTGRLAPGHNTIADFRRDNGPAIRETCAQFVALCRGIGVLKGDCIAIDGSKFKAVNSEAPNATGPSERAERQELRKGQDCQPGAPQRPYPARDPAPAGHGPGVERSPRQPDLPDRPGRPIHGDQRQGKRFCGHFHVLAHTIKRMIALIGVRALLAAIPA
jgi:hypothetical protein